MVSGDWPTLGVEDHVWSPRVPLDALSARQRALVRGPYQAAIVPRIAGLTPQLPNDVAALAAEATVEIARFDSELGAEVAPFASVLLRSESASSSRIENLTSGAKAIALAELGSSEKRNASEIVGNVAAMNAALALANQLDPDAILAMHEALVSSHHPEIAGRWRAEQVWIGGSSISPHGAEYVAPHHDRIPGLVDDLVEFMRRSDLPLLTQAAIAHAQFETIHPFPDGNGRTGRALIHAMLRGHGLTRNVTVPVSAGLLTDTRRYFDSLTAYRDGDPAPIVKRLTQATFSAIVNGRTLVNELRAIRIGWDDRIRARRGSGAWTLAEVLLRQPVIDAHAVAAELGTSPQNALRSVRVLADAGVLTEFTGFARNRMWQSREVLDALDAFAERAGRRNLA